MRILVVRMGENFEKARAGYNGHYFTDLQEAIDWGKLTYLPGERFWVCDENGGVLHIGQVPFQFGIV